MGLRYRKSAKIAPGVKLNLNKKSASVSIGTKGLRTTYSTTGKRTNTVGIPGTGLSYSTSSNIKQESTTNDAPGIQSHSSTPATPQSVEATYRTWSTICFAISIPVVLFSLFLALAKPVALVATAVGIFLFILGISFKKDADTAQRIEETRKKV